MAIENVKSFWIRARLYKTLAPEAFNTTKPDAYWTLFRIMVKEPHLIDIQAAVREHWETTE